MSLQMMLNFSDILSATDSSNLQYAVNALQNWSRQWLLNLNIKQVAQLSQRDRAAGWVSYGQKWKTGTGRQYLRTMCLFNHCDIFGQQRNRNRRKNAK